MVALGLAFGALLLVLPSDVGLLVFPLLAATGLLLRHGGSLLSIGARDLTDGGCWRTRC